MSSTADEVKQRDMLGAVATIYRAAGWPLVVDLHANKANPRQVSGPDFLVIAPGVVRVLKVLGTKGKLSAAQEAVRRHYEAGPVEYVTYTPDDLERVVADASL